jgi:hypothetical protein
MVHPQLIDAAERPLCALEASLMLTEVSELNSYR